MLLEELRNIVEKEKTKKAGEGYIINSIKEYLQNIALEYIYGNKEINHKLVFTGGTCLRFCFDLPRLSEDLDFDCDRPFDCDLIAEDIKNYFMENLGYREIDASVKGREKKIYLKFPVLKQLGLDYHGSFLLLLKIEISKESTADALIETSMVDKNGRTYFVKRYSLGDMMAGKIHAFLTRLFFKGGSNEIDFKGRDMFDLVWFMGKGVLPNIPRMLRRFKGTAHEGMPWKELLEEIHKKAKKVKKNFIHLDLANFIEHTENIDNFLDNYLDIIGQYCKSHK